MKTVKAKNRLNNNSEKQVARYHFAQRALFGCCVAFWGWAMTCRALLASLFLCGLFASDHVIRVAFGQGYAT